MKDDKNEMKLRAAQYATGDMVPEGFGHTKNKFVKEVFDYVENLPKQQPSWDEYFEILNRIAKYLQQACIRIEKTDRIAEIYHIQRFKINRDAYTWNLVKNNKVIASSLDISRKGVMTREALRTCKELNVRFEPITVGERPKARLPIRKEDKMTWKEFKDKVEEDGMTDEMEISWVDWVEGSVIMVTPATEEESAYIG